MKILLLLTLLVSPFSYARKSVDVEKRASAYVSAKRRTAETKRMACARVSENEGVYRKCVSLSLEPLLTIGKINACYSTTRRDESFLECLDFAKSYGTTVSKIFACDEVTKVHYSWKMCLAASATTSIDRIVYCGLETSIPAAFIVCLSQNVESDL